MCVGGGGGGEGGGNSVEIVLLSSKIGFFSIRKDCSSEKGSTI